MYNTHPNFTPQSSVYTTAVMTHECRIISILKYRDHLTLKTAECMLRHAACVQ